MRRNGIIVAIDGPAGAGKSTAARELARRLGYLYLDTGATFRAVALKALAERVDLEDEAAVAAVARGAEIGFERDGPNRVILDGRDVSAAIRAQEVADAASIIAAHRSVREILVELWRQIGKDGGVVLEGRDIGTNVFPDAELKFYLDAREEVRAERRYHERAGEPGVSLPQVARELARRDRADRARAHAPLLRAPEAIPVDTSDRSPAETAELLERAARERLARPEEPA